MSMIPFGNKPEISAPPGAILFACSLNAVRSPMAAALMRYLFPGRVYVESAGVRPGDVDGFAVSAMDEIGLDISDHNPVSFAGLADTSFDIIVTLSPEAHHRALEMTRTIAVDVEYWPSMDPSIASGSRENMLQTYRAIRDQLMQKIKTRFDWKGGPNV